MECPNCGSTEFVFDWSAVISIRVREGETIEGVVVGGVLGGNPDYFICYECGKEIALDPKIEMHKALIDGIFKLAEDQLDNGLTWRLNDGYDLMEGRR